MDQKQEIELKGREIASALTPVDEIAGEDEQDITLLRNMHRAAGGYISSFSWCKRILSSYFGGGVGGIFAVFFFHIETNWSEVDPWIWIAVGDIPSAYLPLSDCNSPGEFFRLYLAGMSRWTAFARKQGRPEKIPENIPPVSLPVTQESADDLDKKLTYLNFLLKPYFEDEPERLM